MTVRLEADARGVTTITLARPEAKHAFDAELISELSARLADIEPSTRCVILRSEGDVFCAGADIGWMGSMVGYTQEENVADSGALASLFTQLDSLPMPLIARVQGAAIGGGAGLVAVVDIAVASSAASFSFSEVRLGIIPAVVAPYVVRRCGTSFTKAAFVSGVRFDARRARQSGLVDAVEVPEHLDHPLDGFVQDILASGPRAVAAAKQLVREVAGLTPREARELTVERIAAVRVSDEGQEGMRAFLERREPRWRA
ncbi:enoyl-CoA hydratase-related protein [soil metagenome]